MRSIKMFAVLFGVVVAIVAVASASASAAAFLSSGTGTLSGTQLESQVFKTGAGTVTCTKLKGTGSVTETMTESQNASIQYEECTAFGIIEAKVTLAEYLFMANGEVTIQKTITITAPGCEIIVPGSKTVSSVSYKNKNSQIEIVPAVTNIESEGKGAFCTYAKETKGTYSGTSLATLGGGTISWSSAG
ncbi:MAG TPA: hypothetical protein VGP17_05335 [Solirubrobacteraceae bacterium]|jgi:hypothetical protein|nr:hypothetical protein [Solirubrobacteraceae bacterium]